MQQPDPRARAFSVPACMGGWCSLRTSCRHYHATDRSSPAERLCSPGQHDCWQPISVQPQHLAEHHALAQVQGVARELAA